MTTNNEGIWVLRDLGTAATSPSTAATQLANATNEINVALQSLVGRRTDGGLGLRFQWQSVETGRVRTTATALLNATTISVAALPSTLATGSILSFDFGAGMPGTTPVEVTLTAQANAGATTLAVVGAHAEIGSGARAGIYDFGFLNTAYGLAIAKGYRFEPRFLAGRWFPPNLVTDGTVTYVETGGTQAGRTACAPWTNAAGAANTGFEQGFVQFVRAIAAWGLSKAAGTVAAINCSDYAMAWAEMYFGPYLQTAYGNSLATSKTRMINAHNRLFDLAVAAAGGYPVAFQLSGQGPLSDAIAGGVAAHVAANWPNSDLIYVGSGGWGYTSSGLLGFWGAPNQGVEDQFNVNVFNSQGVRRYLQDISPPAPLQVGQWDAKFAAADAMALQKPTKIEIYTYQFGSGSIPSMNASQSVLDEMLANIAAWVPFSESNPPLLVEAPTGVYGLIPGSPTFEISPGNLTIPVDPGGSLALTAGQTDASIFVNPAGGTIAVVAGNATPHIGAGVLAGGGGLRKHGQR